MPIIYKPRGRAGEYSEYAANIFSGCDHGCTYCYAPSCTFKSRLEFKKSKPRDLFLYNLQREAPAYRGKECFLCFTCDPYQNVEQETGITRNVIKVLLSSDVGVNILTKGGNRSLRDFDLLAEAAACGNAKYGATLTFTNENQSKEYEPFAALPSERIECLERAHSLGIHTWVSFEPVIEPSQSLNLIELTQKFVDMYKIGKWNHSREASKIDWVEYAMTAINRLKELGKEYYIKKDLEVILEKGGVLGEFMEKND